MSNFCINCGNQGTLDAKPVPDGQDKPFFESGEFDGQSYSDEREVTVLVCSSCSHEMIDLSA